jgi:superfamily II DNA or RNA helicase
MLNDNDAAGGAAASPLAQLQKIFDVLLYSAAEQLADAGCVADVRILQGGRVVTGVASAGAGVDTPANHQTARHRVYIQCRSMNDGANGPAIEGECSCGDRSPCIHVAAVSIVAAKSLVKRSADQHRNEFDPLPRRSQDASMRSAPAQQALCYLIEAAGVEDVGRSDARPCQLSAWVTQTLSGSEHTQSEARAFAPRTRGGNGEYPRYVDAQDREILKTLAAQHVEGPWGLSNAAGFELLQRIVTTGRARWQSLHGPALRRGAARLGCFTWQALPNGDQRLCCEIPGSLDIILHVEPAIYIDTTSNECGPLELPYSLNLLRQYWNSPAIAPEQVAAASEHIAHQSQAAAFPTLRAMQLQRQALADLRAALVLSSGPGAALHFIYNGLAIDSRWLRPDERIVRRLDGDIIYEIERDRETEVKLHAQLDDALAGQPGALAATPQSSEAWLAFMMNGIPRLQALGWEITVDPGFPYRIVAADDWYADLQPNRRQEWFDLQLGVMVDGQPVNLLPALVAYLHAAAGTTATPLLLAGPHLFVPLKDGRYLPVATERIQRIADTLVELFDQDGLNAQHALTLPASQASRLAQLALEPRTPALQSNDSFLPGLIDKLQDVSGIPSLRALIDELKDFSGIAPLAAPAHFQATLRPYQQEGLGWLQFLRRYRLGGILADDMGLGKTVQTLAHLALEKAQGRLHKPSLIVAPVSVLGNWQQEIRRFTPELKLLTLHGPKRRDLFANIETADIIITGYPLLLLDSEVLLARDFSFLILDEAQTIKNPRAKVSRVARALRAEHRLCLTGTPMENHLGELWSLFDFVQPGLLGEESQFQRHYRTPIEKDGNTTRARALSRRIEPFLLRRTKDAVAQELPPKMQIVESIVLDEKQRDFYDGIRLAMHRRVREAIRAQGLVRSHITVLDALLKLRQACCDPRLVKAGEQTQIIPSAKLDWLSTALPELIAEGRRILLFSQFTSMLRLIETVVTELSIPYCLLTGETRDRTTVINRFQTGAVPLFLISLKAGGTGLNLTAADTVIHYDPWWNPAVEMQATDRAHRIGQDKPVFVYKLLAQGTVEEKIMQLQTDKHALASQLYTGKNASPTQLNAADLEALFAP